MSDRPEDWVLVPREPTEEMYAAMSANKEAFMRAALSNGHIPFEQHGAIWKAMIAAAPKPGGLVIAPATEALLARGEENVAGGRVK